MVEVPQSAASSRSPESHSQGEFCLFLAGVLGTEEGITPIGNALRSFFGDKNVSTVPSLVSRDPKGPEKYQPVAEELIKRLGENQKVTIIAHSGGSVELAFLIAAAKKLNPNIKEKFNKIEVILISPVGLFKGSRETAQFLLRLGWLLRSMFLGGPLTGIDSIGFSPPDSHLINPTELILALRQVFPQLSQHIEGLPAATLEQVIESSYDLGLDQKTNNRLSEIDASIKDTLASQNWRQLKKLLIQRGRLLSPFMAKAFAGQERKEETEEKKPNLHRLLKIGGQVMLGFARLSQTALSGQVLKILTELDQEGTRIFFLLPEYDIVVTLDEIARFLKIPKDKVAQLAAFIVEMTPFTHSGWALRPQILTEALKALRNTLLV